MRHRLPSMAAGLLALVVFVSFALASAATGSAATSANGWNVLSDPINPGQLTEMPWGASSC